MKIKKYSGEIVSFKEEKLINSLVSSGADIQTAKEILKEIQPRFYDGIPSKKIYKLAFQKLKSISKAHAARYGLKKGLMDLGPAGFHFEKFISRLFELQKYQAITNVFLDGKCTSHEVDILIKKNDHVAMVECKFHGSQEVKTDVKAPMYILSRFNDLKTNRINLFSADDVITGCWLVTNNKFTSQAIEFGECSGLSLLSWDFPIGNGIKDLVKEFKVYPITCLTTLTIAEKELLLIQDILTVYNLIHDKNGFDKLKLSQSRLINVQNECNQLLNM